jgi:hypothetical protein
MVFYQNGLNPAENLKNQEPGLEIIIYTNIIVIGRYQSLRGEHDGTFSLGQYAAGPDL